ncbi:hypothetical protein B0I37DRAFT_239525 [Chaetomium sp. MPI-CAGE-AT-0009]|nr:hypothetical protein B0I37DRAFT_239525 [Chaetomium sp. MPI-CAGE-AT-0009]
MSRWSVGRIGIYFPGGQMGTAFGSVGIYGGNMASILEDQWVLGLPHHIWVGACWAYCCWILALCIASRGALRLHRAFRGHLDRALTCCRRDHCY